MANPMVITLNHFETMQKNFQQHYFLANCNSDFGGQDIQVPWDSFALAVQNFIKSSKASPDTVAMRFVLCYDTANNALFLRMQICTMTATSDPNTFNLDTTNCAWYTIEDGSLAPTAITDLFDQNYVDNFYYCDKGGMRSKYVSEPGIRYIRNNICAKHCFPLDAGSTQNLRE